MSERRERTTAIEVHKGPNAFDAPGLMDDVLAVYATAFGSPPWNESADRVAGYRTRAATGVTQEDFVLAVARSDEGRVVGFSTAWTTPDPFPTGRMYDDIAANLDPEVIRDRLVGRTEVEELAVHPDARGAGLGRALLGEVTRSDRRRVVGHRRVRRGRRPPLPERRLGIDRRRPRSRLSAHRLRDARRELRGALI